MVLGEHGVPPLVDLAVLAEQREQTPAVDVTVMDGETTLFDGVGYGDYLEQLTYLNPDPASVEAVLSDICHTHGLRYRRTSEGFILYRP